MVASGQSLVLEYFSIVLSALMFLMTGCGCEEPCLAIIRINDPWRDVTVVNDNADGKNCDKDGFHPNQWYSFEIDNQPAMIPTTCVQSHRCGATIGMRVHLEGQAMPERGEYVNASLCGSYNVLGSYDCCVLRSPVAIFKCKNNDYVYKFPSPIDRCPAAICTQKIHEQVPKQAIALMGDPHPDRWNTTVSRNDEDAYDEESGPENPPEDIMIQEDENPFDIGNNTQQQRGINETQYPSLVTSVCTDAKEHKEARDETQPNTTRPRKGTNSSQQSESNTTEIALEGISPTTTTPDGDDNVSNNGNNTTSGNTDTSVITAATSPETSMASTIPNHVTTSSTGQASNTSTLTTPTTEKDETPTSTSTQDISSKDHGSPLPVTTNATVETTQITNKNNTTAVNTTSITTKESSHTDEFVTVNTTTPSSGLETSPPSSSPTASLSLPPLVTTSPSPSATASSSSSTPVSTSASTSTVPTTISTTSTAPTARVTSASTTTPSTSSSSTQPITLPSSTSAASSSSSQSTTSTDSEPSVSLSPSPPPGSTTPIQSQSTTLAQSSSMTQSQSTTMALSSPATQSQYPSISQSSRATQSSFSDITTQFPPPSTHEVLVIELVRFVFLGGFWDESFSQQVMMLLTYFLNQEMALRRVDEHNLDPWFEITKGETVVEDRNETTHLDTRITHAWPEQLLFLFQTTDFADYLYEQGNLSLLVACRPSKLCQMDDDYYYTVAPPNPSNKTPQKSPPSTFDKNLPVLIAVTAICAFCLIVMATGVMCAKCRKKRRSWNAGNDVEKKSLKDNRPNCQGTPSPFTDTQIMSDEEAADGSANGSALDGGETLQGNSWVVPLEDIELDEINKEVVAETTEDTKF